MKNLKKEEIDLFGNTIEDKIKSKLREKYIIPPFSILDSKQGYWQKRKKEWLDLGIKSEIGRGDLIHEKGISLSEGTKRINKTLEKYKSQKKKTYGKVFSMNNWAEKKANEGQNFAKSYSTGINISQMYKDKALAKAKGEKFSIKEWNENNQKTADNKGFSDTSIFDPVLTEIMYRWFCKKNGLIFDPFAGGSVRGIVASILEFNYKGIDLRKEQIEANYEQLKDCDINTYIPKWFCDNSLNLNNYFEKNEKADLIFSCPPYFDLERYSEDPDDLSNMDYEKFKDIYFQIINKSIKVLNENRFAVFVVGEIRDKEGIYRNFVDYTKECFLNSEMNFYNEIIYVNVVGSLPIRINNQFKGNRKIGKMHQNVLVFYKGDVKQIKNIFGENIC